MIMTEERAILKAKEQFDEMIEMIRQGATEGWMINEVEGDIWLPSFGKRSDGIDGYALANCRCSVHVRFTFGVFERRLGRIPTISYRGQLS